MSRRDRITPWWVSSALCLAASVSSAERLFIGVMEADSYQSVIYGASAFSRVADVPIILEMVNSTLSSTLLVPNFAAVSAGALLRVVQTVDPSLPRSDSNPANVAIIPLSGGLDAVGDMFGAAYAARSNDGALTSYEKPASTNLPPRVFTALSGRHLLTSVSQDALRWAWENRARLIDAPPQSIPGTLRVLVNPQRLADLLGARSEKTAPLFNLDKLIRDFETLSFALSLDGQAVAFTVRGKPRPDTDLDALSHAFRAPSAHLWNGLPDTSFFSSLSACDRHERWDAYLGKSRFRLLRPAAELVAPGVFGGERLIYLAPTKDKQGLCLVNIETVTNMPPVTSAIEKLHTVKSTDGIQLVRRPQRSVGPTRIESYTISITPPASAEGAKTAEPSTLFTLMSLFLKQATLETALCNGYLVTVLGPPNTMETQLDNLSFAAPSSLTLCRRINAQDPALDQGLYQGAFLSLATLLRHIVAIMPGVRPEHLRVLPAGGDGATFGICPGEDHALTASLRFQSNEIAALQRINRDGREVLQELFFQMFSSQMLNLQHPGKEGGDKGP